MLNRKQPLIDVCIVIYNQECTQSPSCISVLNAECSAGQVRVTVVDNSTKPNNNEIFCRENHWDYLQMGENAGLSRAYNCFLDHLPDLSEDKLVLWLDDDTHFPPEFISKLCQKAIEEPDCTAFAPIVYGGNGVIYSPNERRFFKNKFVLNDGAVPRQKQFNAINSGLAVRSSFYRNYRYDERLFMDSVDQKFCSDICAANAKFAVLDVKIQHSFFQRDSALSKEKVWQRYRIRIHDFSVFSNTDKWHRWLGFLKVCGWSVEMGIKCRSFSLFGKMTALGFWYAIKLSLGCEIAMPDTNG